MRACPDAIVLCKAYLACFPQHCEAALPAREAKDPLPKAKDIAAIVPTDIMSPFQMKDFIESLVAEVDAYSKRRGLSRSSFLAKAARQAMRA